MGSLWRFDALLQLGEVDAAQTELDGIRQAANRLRRPWPAGPATQHGGDGGGSGPLRPAVTLSLDALEVIKRGRHPRTPSHGLLVAVSLLTCRDDLPVQEAPRPEHLRWGNIAWWHLEFGRTDDARAVSAGLPPLDRVPAFTLLSALAGYARLAAAFDNAATAAAAYERLAPSLTVTCAAVREPSSRSAPHTWSDALARVRTCLAAKCFRVTDSAFRGHGNRAPGCRMRTQIEAAARARLAPPVACRLPADPCQSMQTAVASSWRLAPVACKTLWASSWTISLGCRSTSWRGPVRCRLERPCVRGSRQ